jgi:predicted flap endonuclease-1-like 5' DNA nuclease
MARSPKADDLKRIRGIGVMIENRLRSLGMVNYEQIANWTAEDIDRVSQTLDFKGRIERENWVEQARILASGGATEFSRRVDRGELESSRAKR